MIVSDHEDWNANVEVESKSIELNNEMASRRGRRETAPLCAKFARKYAVAAPARI